MFLSPQQKLMNYVSVSAQAPVAAAASVSATFFLPVVDRVSSVLRVVICVFVAVSTHVAAALISFFQGILLCGLRFITHRISFLNTSLIRNANTTIIQAKLSQMIRTHSEFEHYAKLWKKL